MKDNINNLLVMLETSIKNNNFDNTINVLNKILSLVDLCDKEELIKVITVLEKYKDYL